MKTVFKTKVSRKTARIIALVAIIAFSMAALSLTGCVTTSDYGTVSDLNGMWRNSAGNEYFMLEDGIFTATVDNIAAFKGTCTGSAARITLTITEWHGAALNEQQSDIYLENKWYTKSQLSDALRVWAKKENPTITDFQISQLLNESGFNSMFRTYRATISGTTMTISGSKYDYVANSSVGVRVSPVPQDLSQSSIRFMLVNVDALNVRSGPSVDYASVGTLTRNARVEVLSNIGTWWRIRAGSIEGYVNSSYLRVE